MGDPKKHRKKYNPPAILWNKTQIEDDSNLIKDYGLKNKKEIWRFKTLNKRFAKDAKKLMVLASAQSKKEKKQMFARLESYGILSSGTRLGDVLGLHVTDFLNRRLQTLVHKKGLAASVKQARQFITHGHITIGDNKVTVPSHLITIAEESQIKFAENSALSDPDHPERSKGKEVAEKKEEKAAPAKKKVERKEKKVKPKEKVDEAKAEEPKKEE